MPEIWMLPNGGSNAPVRKSDSEDFLLRGFVTCGACNETMTGAWSKGRNTKYVYYFCFNKGCREHRKSIRKKSLKKTLSTFFLGYVLNHRFIQRLKKF